MQQAERSQAKGLEFTPLEFETGQIFRTYERLTKLEFTPLEFETLVKT